MTSYMINPNQYGGGPKWHIVTSKARHFAKNEVRMV